jgi:hypothetical protein
VRYRVRVGVKVSRKVGLTETDSVKEWRGEEEPETDTVLVLDMLMLPVDVELMREERVRARLDEWVGLAERVRVAAAVDVPQEVCVEDLELLVEEV